MSPTAAGVGAAWAALVAAALSSRRPWPRRLRALVPVGGRPRRRDVSTTVGEVTLAVLVRGTGRDDMARRQDPRRVGRAVLAATAALVVLPPAAPGVGGLVWGVPGLRRRRERLAAVAVVRRQLAEVVDLLALVTGAGYTVPLAVEAVARRAGGPIGAALGDVVRAAGAGRRLCDALADLPERLGDDVRPLVAALVASDRDGSPLGASLERLATELRHDRRRRAEAIARRVPVKLLFPLVTCILPAFALLTVAPLLASALAALRP